ncbi:MAG: hypothetical protein ACW99E_22220 [Promethearchaeota archaeon]
MKHGFRTACDKLQRKKNKKESTTKEMWSNTDLDLNKHLASRGFRCRRPL